MKKLILLVLLLAPLSLFAQKFGHFNSEDIVKIMPEFEKTKLDIQTLQKQYEDDLKRVQDEFNKKQDEYAKQRDSLPDNIKERREQELQGLYTRMQQSAQDNQQALEKAYREKMAAISTKVITAVKAIGETGSYIYIMDTSAGIPYISKTLSTDITPQIKSKLGLK
ncbi:MAG: OmpH family outer membrane protein [Bacteroidaceae bacterium]